MTAEPLYNFAVAFPVAWLPLLLADVLVICQLVAIEVLAAVTVELVQLEVVPL
jgi:hypothetical protein